MEFTLNIGRSVLGLTIGSDTVSIVELRRGLKDYELLNYYERPFYEGEKGETAAAKTVKALFTEKKLFGKRVVVSLPDDRVTFRFLSLPFADKKKINSIIKYEVEGLLPLSADEIIVDYLPLATDNGKTDLLAVIAHKEALRERMDLLAKAGIDPEIVETNLLGVFHFAQHKLGNSAGNVMVLDIGTAGTSLCVIGKGKMKCIKSISSSNIDTAGESEPLEKEPDTAFGATAHQGIGKELILEIKRTMIWLDQKNEETIDRIILGGRFVPGLEKLLAAQFNIEPVRWNPLEGFHCDKRSIPAGTIAASSVGLALRGINGHFGTLNLRKEEFAQKHIFEGLWEILRNSLIMLGIILSLFMFTMYYKNRTLETRYLQLKNEGRRIFKESVPGVGKIVDEVHQLKEKVQEIKKSYELIGGYANDGRSALDWLRQITEKFPKDGKSEIYYYSFNKEEVRVEGMAGSFETVDLIKTELARETAIKKIKVTEARLGADQVSVKFKMTIFPEGDG